MLVDNVTKHGKLRSISFHFPLPTLNLAAMVTQCSARESRPIPSRHQNLKPTSLAGHLCCYCSSPNSAACYVAVSGPVPVPFTCFPSPVPSLASLSISHTCICLQSEGEKETIKAHMTEQFGYRYLEHSQLQIPQALPPVAEALNTTLAGAAAASRGPTVSDKEWKTLLGKLVRLLS